MVTTDASVNSTVEPDTATDDTDRDTPATVTAKSDTPAVVADNDSEYVKITFVPAAFTAADTNVGAVKSGPKELPDTPLTFVGVNLLVVVLSPSCP